MKVRAPKCSPRRQRALQIHIPWVDLTTRSERTHDASVGDAQFVPRSGVGGWGCVRHPSRSIVNTNVAMRSQSSSEGARV